FKGGRNLRYSGDIFFVLIDMILLIYNQVYQINQTEMKTKLFFLILILQAFSPVYAQLNELWTLRYSGIPTGIDEVRGMVIDEGGNVYQTGRSQGTGLNNNFDFATLKITPSGDTVWVEHYDGGGSGLPVDEANDIAVDANGNVYV